MKNLYKRILKSEDPKSLKIKGVNKIFKTLAVIGSSTFLAFNVLGQTACNNKNNETEVDQPVINQPIDNLESFLKLKAFLSKKLHNLSNCENISSHIVSDSNSKFYVPDIILNVSICKTEAVTKSQGEIYEEFKCKHIGVPLFDEETNYASAKYFDGEKTHLWKTDKNNYNLKDAHYSSSTELQKSEDTLKIEKYINFIDKYFNVDSSAFSAIRKRTPEGEHQIRITIKTHNLPYSSDYDEFLRIKEDYSPEDFIIEYILQQDLTFYINLDDGYLTSVSQNILCSGEFKPLNVDCEIRRTASQYFTNHNQETTIHTPPIPEQSEELR